MKVPTEKHKAIIACRDGRFVKGCVHIPQGLRPLDFLNDHKEQFIAVTDAKFPNVGRMRSFRLYKEFQHRENLVILNKNSIEWVEGIDG